MKDLCLALVAGLLFLSLGSVLLAQGTSRPPRAQKMLPLFGEKLADADYDKEVWSINEQGELSANKDSVIWTKKKYGSCFVSFEYKLSSKSNGGFLIQCSNKKDWIPNTIEIQLLDDAGSQPNYHGNASFYGYQAPGEVLTKPAGEWNKMDVFCHGRKIRIMLNGKLVNEIDTGEWKDATKGPAGTEIEKKFQGKALADSEPFGFIGLQGLHGKAPIFYRNLKISTMNIPEDVNTWPLLFGEKLENAEFNPEIWSLKDGIMTANKDDVIWSKEKYKDFMLYLEYNCAEKANSGIVIKCSDKKNWIPNSLEVQIFDSFGREKVDFSDCGAIYGRKAPNFNRCNKPGEWNKMMIFCNGNGRIMVSINGEPVTFMNTKDFTDKVKNPDGTNAYSWLTARAPADQDDNGFIGIQGLHDKAPVQYRNVRIKKMTFSSNPNKK